MKVQIIKIMLIALISAFAFACDNDKEKEEQKPEIKDGTFIGTIKVNENTPAFYEQHDVEIITEIIGTSSLTIKILRIRFAEQMPVNIDIAVEGIELTETKDGYSLYGNDIVPTAMGIPFSDYTITEMNGILTSESLEFSMICGTFPVHYSGIMGGF